jgi:hypothetical protein
MKLLVMQIFPFSSGFQSHSPDILNISIFSVLVYNLIKIVLSRKLVKLGHGRIGRNYDFYNNIKEDVNVV